MRPSPCPGAHSSCPQRSRDLNAPAQNGLKPSPSRWRSVAACVFSYTRRVLLALGALLSTIGCALELGVAPPLLFDAGPSEDRGLPDERDARSIDGGAPSADLAPPPAPPASPEGPLGVVPGRFLLTVTLDGAPAPDAIVTQGGTGRRFPLDEHAQVWIDLDPSALGLLAVMAAHPDARTGGEEVSADRRAPLTIELRSFSREDNEDYRFADPGVPGRRGSTAQCGHCHLTINDRWFASPHARAAQNPIVHDLYSGRAAGINDEERCGERGGRWALGRTPGEDEESLGCFFPVAALPALNDTCDAPPCDPSELENYGGCADCHAPTAVQAGGRGAGDLLKVRGESYAYGVSCDLCHRVESVDVDAPAGVGGRLKLLRPSEGAPVTLGAGGLLPLTFGPSVDVSNPRMGVSPRPHFRSGRLCAGCHQHDHDTHEVPSLDAAVDRARWPSGLIPNQSTWREWEEGPLGALAPCNSCHMPPEGAAAQGVGDQPLANSANLERFPDADIGFQGGWPRRADESRQHAWWGPRQPESMILERAAALRLWVKVEGESLTARVAVSNVGAGHFLPTGEPMRHLILLVEAACEGAPLEPLGGDAVPDFGGALMTLPSTPGENLDLGQPLIAPGATVGDHLSFIEPGEGYHDYPGYGPFALGGRFSPEEKGMPRERALGRRQIIAVAEDGALTLDEPPPLGATRAYLLRSDETGEGYAGRPGFAFARVPVDAEGRRMVPHFISVDLASDNRLPPQESWESSHRFPASCPAPTVEARLVYRRYPLWLARERGWTLADRSIATARWERSR